MKISHFVEKIVSWFFFIAMITAIVAIGYSQIQKLIPIYIF